MDIRCNSHAQSFTREEALADKHYPMTDAHLGLEGEYTFVYTYPLSITARIQHPLVGSVSAIDVLLIAQKDYEYIYAAEEKADGNPGHIPGMLNRQASEGPYGIWGHDFSDLYFENINIDNVKKVISFGMGS
jgi:hypothetical protein